MKKIHSIGLLEDLQADTRQIILSTNYLSQEDPSLLLRQPAPGRWSAAQVIAHLNSYGRYYLPTIELAMNEHSYEPDPVFTPGWLGDYFTKSMLPGKNGQVVNKMQAPKNHRPSADIDSKPVIDEFLRQEQLLLELLESAKHLNISRITIPISLTKLVKLKLGDTFRFLVAHHQRHFVQINNTLKEIKQMNNADAKYAHT
ncbi:MAG TPA: DinB family protein [Chitinophagaceae bacterium]|nr:DinB family protein [Chitinophagaceae bacterium]